MESEPQDDYKRNNKFGAVQVITDVVTFGILREPAVFDLLQVPRHRLHQPLISLPQHTCREQNDAFDSGRLDTEEEHEL